MLVEYILDPANLLPISAAILSFLIILAIESYYRTKKLHRIFKEVGIPGPEPEYLGGNFRQILKLQETCNPLTYWTKKYGKVYGLFMADFKVVVVSDLDYAKDIFLESKSVFTERQDIIIRVKPISESILFARHSKWKFTRKILSPAFSFYGSKAPESTFFIENTVQEMLEFLTKQVNVCDDGKKRAKNIEIQVLMKAAALSLISSVAIKLKECPINLTNEHVKKLDEFLLATEGGVFVYAVMFPKFARFLEWISNRFEFSTLINTILKPVEDEIDIGLKYLRGEVNDDYLKSIYVEQPKAIIHRMIKLHYEGKMSRIELLGNAETILLAGYDTTSTTLTYCLWALGKYTDLQDKLRKDILLDGVESRYLSQFINETMRIYPAVESFTKRIPNRDFKIGNFTIPKGTNVTYNATSVHLDPEVWPDPLRFDPERFREGAEIHPCAFAPFGLGERRCLGYKLAILEMKYVLVGILPKFNIALISPQDLVILPSANVLTKPRDPVFIDFELIES